MKPDLTSYILRILGVIYMQVWVLGKNRARVCRKTCAFNIMFSVAWFQNLFKKQQLIFIYFLLPQVRNTSTSFVIENCAYCCAVCITLTVQHRKDVKEILKEHVSQNVVNSINNFMRILKKMESYGVGPFRKLIAEPNERVNVSQSCFFLLLCLWV